MLPNFPLSGQSMYSGRASFAKTKLRTDSGCRYNLRKLRAEATRVNKTSGEPTHNKGEDAIYSRVSGRESLRKGGTDVS
jgi:hypothetical protein